MKIKYLLILITFLAFIVPNSNAQGINASKGNISVTMDSDGDGILDHLDNCVNFPNAMQENNDEDEFGDACDCDQWVLEDKTFTEFQNILNTSIDTTGDGRIEVCLIDDVLIYNNNTIAASQIAIPQDYMSIYARPNSGVELRNERTTGNSLTDRTGIFMTGKYDVQLSGFDIYTSDATGIGIRVQYSKISRLVDMKIFGGGMYSGSPGIWLYSKASVDFMERVVIKTQARRAFGIKIDSAGVGIQPTIENSPRIMHMKDVTIATSGENAHGILLGYRAIINHMDNVVIKRRSGANDQGVAILVLVPSAGSPDYDLDYDPFKRRYFNTPFINNVKTCRAGSTDWEHHLAESTDSGGFQPYHVPTQHIPFSEPNGIYWAQTFPFNDLHGSTSGTDQGIEFLNDSCN